jgi:hypothetical protein
MLQSKTVKKNFNSIWTSDLQVTKPAHYQLSFAIRYKYCKCEKAIQLLMKARGSSRGNTGSTHRKRSI